MKQIKERIRNDLVLISHMSGIPGFFRNTRWWDCHSFHVNGFSFYW